MVTILQAAAALRAKQISSVELTDEALARIARLNPKLNAFITVLDDEARARARQADAEIAAGVDLGPLHGVPIAVKDVFATKGHRTTAGSKLFFNNITDYDAAAVEKLRIAGAVIVGKTNLHELAFGITSNNPHFGAVHTQVSETHAGSARLFVPQSDRVTELRSGPAGWLQDIQRSGRICNESLGERENGKTPADALVCKGCPPPPPGSLRGGGVHA